MVDHLFNRPQTLLRQIHVTPKPEAGQLLKGSASWKMTAWARRSTVVRSIVIRPMVVIGIRIKQ